MTKNDVQIFCCISRRIAKLHQNQHVLEEIEGCFKNGNSTQKEHAHFLKLHFLNNSSPYKEDECELPMFSCNEKMTAPYIAYIAIWSLLLATILLSNVLVLLALRKIQFSVTNLFICSLAVSDMFVGLFIIPIKIKFAANKLKFCMGEYMCRFYITADNAFFTASITNIFVICVDRYLALNYPYKHPCWITKSRSKLLVGFVWIYGVLWGISANIKWDNISKPAIHIRNDQCQINRNYIYVTSILTVVFFAPVCLMGAFYARILVIAKFHAKEISMKTIFPNVSRMIEMLHEIPRKDLNDDIADRIIPLQNERKCGKRKEMQIAQYRKMVIKASKTIAILYGTFVVCWSPVGCLSIVLSYSTEEVDWRHLKWFYITFVEILPVMNSVLNPFIYTMRNKQYRNAVTKTLSKLNIFDINYKNDETVRFISRSVYDVKTSAL